MRLAQRLAYITLLFALLGSGCNANKIPIIGSDGEWRGSIGAILVQKGSGRVYVKEVPPDHAAAKAGVEVGDEIVAIDDKETRGMTPDEVSGALRGKVGTKVKLEVERRGERKTIVVERGPLD
jgi:C-terminal processing protease CtpA/Prc